MPKRKRVFMQSGVKAQRDKVARGNETEEERERRLASEGKYSQRMRASKSEIERESVREVDRARKRIKNIEKQLNKNKYEMRKAEKE